MCKCSVLNPKQTQSSAANGARLATSQTLESDHYVCIRQKLDEEDKPQVIIIDLKNNNDVMRRPINADSAIMHWNKNIIALKAQGRTVQIFDLAAKAKLKSAIMNEDIVYWKWFSEKSLGLVTDSSVYHWDVYDATQQSPVKVFDRLPNLAVCGSFPLCFCTLEAFVENCVTNMDGLPFLGMPNHQLPRQLPGEVDGRRWN